MKRPSIEIQKCNCSLDKRTSAEKNALSDVIRRVMFMDPCIIIYISQKEPTRCNRVVEFIIPVLLNCSTCFGRHTAHHQELENCNCSLWFYIRLWFPVAAMAQPSHLSLKMLFTNTSIQTRKECRRSIKFFVPPLFRRAMNCERILNHFSCFSYCTPDDNESIAKCVPRCPSDGEIWLH